MDGPNAGIWGYIMAEAMASIFPCVMKLFIYVLTTTLVDYKSTCMCNWTNLETECLFNTLRPRQNGRHFADDVLKCIFLNENVWILLKISLKFVPRGEINNTPSLVQIMTWPRPGDKSLSERMMVGLQTHICATRPQWVNTHLSSSLRFTLCLLCMWPVTHTLSQNMHMEMSFMFSTGASHILD